MQNKEVLVELKKIADMLNISLKDLLFGHSDNILILKNDADKQNIKKDITDKNIIMNSQIENWQLKTTINVPDWYKSDKPLHFCFILDQKWTKQVVQPTWNIGNNVKIKIFAYCFGVEYEILHWDSKIYNIWQNSSVEIYEFNYNKTDSYLKVWNSFKAYLQEWAYFKNYYSSTVWHLGHWITLWEVYLDWDNSKAEFISKNKILNWDISDTKVTFYLNWKKTSWLISSKSVTYEWWKSKFVAKLIWKWDFARWHIDCSELSLWKCEINTIPELEVLNSTVRFTHEASVWTVEQKTIDNLLIKWFTQDEAIDFIVKWVLD